MNTNRYIRQTTLKEFGPGSQKKLGAAKVLVVGAGGLGIPVLQYLTAMGVGTIGIVENDTVDLTNLQRQVIYSEGDIGQPKIYSLINKLKNLNGEVEFLPYKTFLTPENALRIISNFDVVVDASDNFPTRYLINDSCVILEKPFIYGALHSFEGQVSVFNYNVGPTYRCIFPKMPAANEVPDCNENGVLGVIPGIIGTLQALEAVKVITGIGEILSGRLLIYDGLRQEFNNIVFELKPQNQKIKRLQDNYGFIKCETENSISAEDFFGLSETKNNMIVIDVRSKAEYLSGHLPNSENIPIETIADNFQLFGANSQYYLICQSGQRSQKAVNLLNSHFSEKIFINIKGGYNAMDTNLTSTE